MLVCEMGGIMMVRPSSCFGVRALSFAMDAVFRRPDVYFKGDFVCIVKLIRI